MLNIYQDDFERKQIFEVLIVKFMGIKLEKYRYDNLQFFYSTSMHNLITQDVLTRFVHRFSRLIHMPMAVQNPQSQVDCIYACR